MPLGTTGDTSSQCLGWQGPGQALPRTEREEPFAEQREMLEVMPCDSDSCLLYRIFVKCLEVLVRFGPEEGCQEQAPSCKAFPSLVHMSERVGGTPWDGSHPENGAKK